MNSYDFIFNQAIPSLVLFARIYIKPRHFQTKTNLSSFIYMLIVCVSYSIAIVPTIICGLEEVSLEALPKYIMRLALVLDNGIQLKIAIIKKRKRKN